MLWTKQDATKPASAWQLGSKTAQAQCSTLTSLLTAPHHRNRRRPDPERRLHPTHYRLPRQRPSQRHQRHQQLRCLRQRDPLRQRAPPERPQLRPQLQQRHRAAQQRRPGGTHLRHRQLPHDLHPLEPRTLHGETLPPTKASSPCISHSSCLPTGHNTR